MKIPSLAATAALMAATDSAGFFASSSSGVREKKEFTHFDQERLDKATEKRARKAAKRMLMA